MQRQCCPTHIIAHWQQGSQEGCMMLGGNLLERTGMSESYFKRLRECLVFNTKRETIHEDEVSNS